MNISTLKDTLEHQQIGIYFAAILLAVVVAFIVPGTEHLEVWANPALALMLFVTFLQVPMTELRHAFTRGRFLAALMLANFVAIPLFVGLLSLFFPASPMVQLGVLLVLLTPCIDYVVTFSQLGRADARLLLAAAPILLIVQIVLLPLYLQLFLGDAATGLVQLGPFLQAFLWLIAAPLVLAAVTQFWAARNLAGAQVSNGLGLLPVPATALVLFVVIAAVTPRVGEAMDAALRALPLYIAFAVFAPLIGWGIARLFRLEPKAGRAVAFSASTRNSLVVLPRAFAVPGAIPLLPSVIVTQTFVELLSELVYVRLLARLGGQDSPPTVPLPS
jgi:ACR3 family arsenite transporter